MVFNDLKQTWDQLASDDPLWAILTDSDKKGNRWDLEAFFASGDQLVQSVLQSFDRLDLVRPYGKALDFGCGVGRLTRPLANSFDRAVGVDISAAMIDQARRFAPERVEFVHNPHADLRLFADAEFDYIQSFLVIQHMHPEYQQGYLREFARILKPGGWLVFQAPSKDWNPAREDAINGLVPPDETTAMAGMRNFAMPAPMTLAILDEVGLDVKAMVEDAGRGEGFVQMRYYAVKAGEHPPYVAAFGFEEAMGRISERARIRLQEAGRIGSVRHHEGSVATGEEVAYLRKELAALRQEHETVLATNAWKWGSRLSRLAARIHRKNR